MTSRERLASLTCCSDTASLRAAVRALCTEFGEVMKLDVFTMTEAEKRRALCFLRLESAAEEQAMLGVDDEAPAAFEGEVGICAEAVLGVGVELHVAIELRADVRAGASDERLRVSRIPARDETEIAEDDAVAIPRRARGHAYLPDEK